VESLSVKGRAKESSGQQSKASKRRALTSCWGQHPEEQELYAHINCTHFGKGIWRVRLAKEVVQAGAEDEPESNGAISREGNEREEDNPEPSTTQDWAHKNTTERIR
jgi:hypothetical protein